ncbi:MAG: hypothetical protein HY890_03750 [Deltaproteobacteria bacterium]|nr:hypothetical protein [Deltaproteobacteria bacterium]
MVAIGVSELSFGFAFLHEQATRYSGSLLCAPLIIGGDGVPSIGDLGIKGVKKAFRIRDMKTKRVEGDIMVEGYV